MVVRVRRIAAGLRTRSLALTVVLGLVAGVVATAAIPGPASAASPVICAGSSANASLPVGIGANDPNVTVPLAQVYIPPSATVTLTVTMTNDHQANTNTWLAGLGSSVSLSKGGIYDETVVTSTGAKTFTNGPTAFWSTLSTEVDYDPFSTFVHVTG